MIVGVLVGVGLGVVVTSAVGLLVGRSRRRAVLRAVDRFDGPEAGHWREVVPRLRHVVGRLEGSAAEAERATRRLEAALDRVTEGIVVCDADGRVVFTNAAGSVLATPRHGDALVAAAVSECLQSAVGGEVDSRSVELFGPPARTVTVDARPLGGSARPLGGSDEQAGAVATITDQSRLRRLESVRSDFVANVSHELKTPIGGLALLAEALSGAATPAEQERLAGRLLDEAHRVGRVVDDLLALSEVEGDLPPRRELVPAGDLLARIGADVAVLAEGYGVEVELSDVGDGLWLEGDPIQLTSALNNLVENAVKYSGGVSPVRLTVDGQDGLVRFTVQDRGIGIPRQDLDRVFERFFRVDRARSQATGGTGLGLALVRNIVRAHGGEVDLTSREGEGTTVVVALPAVAVPDSRTAGPDEPVTEGGA